MKQALELLGKAPTLEIFSCGQLVEPKPLID